MTNAQAVRLAEVARRKTDEFFTELIAELDAAGPVEGPAGGGDPAAGESASDPSVWSLPATPMTGDWDEVDRSTGETFRWGDGNVDHYPEFVRYRGSGDYTGTYLALGYKENGDVVGFVLGTGGGSKRGITYFFPADDFATSREKLSMIRGGGPRGRSGFSPADPEPPGYAGYTLETLASRIAGKWNVLGVVADTDAIGDMLGHTALQAKLRGLA